MSDELSASRQEATQLQFAREELGQEVERLRAFEQQAVEQQRLVEVQGRQLEEMSRDLQRSEACERMQTAALRDKAVEIRALSNELDGLIERAQRLALVEDALESAVELAERQNSKHKRVRSSTRYFCESEDDRIRVSEAT